MTKIGIEGSENPSRGILKIFKYISPLVFLCIYYAISMYIWMFTIESSRYYFSDFLPNIHIQNSINLWINIFKISLFYILPLLIPFWVQFLISFTVYGKLKHLHKTLSGVSGLFAYFVSGFITVILNKLFKDMQGAPEWWYIFAVFISIFCAILLANWLQCSGEKHYGLRFLISDRRVFYAVFVAPLIITLIISLLAPIYNYKKGYGLSCDALSSARNYSNDGEEYIFSNKKNIDDQDIGSITPNMLEHKESSGNSKREENKYDEFHSRQEISDNLLSSTVDKDNPISIKFLKLKDEGDSIIMLITDVRKVYQSNYAEPMVTTNLLSNPVVITVPKKDLIGSGDGSNSVEKLCTKDRYN